MSRASLRDLFFLAWVVLMPAAGILCLHPSLRVKFNPLPESRVGHPLETLLVWTGRIPGPPRQQFKREDSLFEEATWQVGYLAREPHPPGSPALEKVQAHLLEELEACGFEVRIHETRWEPPPANPWHSTYPDGVVLQNLVARRPQHGDRKLIVGLFAHSDTRPGGGPGAADDSMGLAVILAAARHLKLESIDLRIVLTDGEEIGLRGAEAFVGEAPEFHDLDFVLNLEARGNAGPVVAFELGRPRAPLARLLAREAPSTVASSLSEAIYELLPNDTDFTHLKRGNRRHPGGLPGINLAVLDGFAAYHTGLDTPENLSRASLRHLVQVVTGILKALDRDPASFRNLDPDTPGDAHTQFYPVLGAGLVTHRLPVGLGLGLLGAGLLVGWRSWRGRKRAAPFSISWTCQRVYRFATGVLLYLGVKLALWTLARDLFTAPHGESLAVPLESLALWVLVIALLTTHFVRDPEPLPWLRLEEGLLVLLTAASLFFLPGGLYLLFWPLVGVVLVHAAGPAAPESSGARFPRSLIVLVASLGVLLVFPPTLLLLDLGLGYDPYLAPAVTSLLALLGALWCLPPLLEVLSPSKFSGRVLTILAVVLATLSLAARPLGF